VSVIYTSLHIPIDDMIQSKPTDNTTRPDVYKGLMNHSKNVDSGIAKIATVKITNPGVRG
jgi:hypothetical protein